MISLPKSKAALTSAIDIFVDEAEARYLPKFLQMALAYLYVQGHRDLKVANLHTGDILMNRIDWETGRKRFIDNRVQTKYNRAVEHLMKLDFSPVVEAEEVGLSAVRERASAQVIIDAISDVGTTDAYKQQVAECAPLYGGVGTLGSVAQHKVIGFGADYEVVPPWNIFPMPLSGMNLNSDLSGIMLRRFKTMDWMKETYGKRVTRHRNEMDVWTTNPGVHSVLSSIDQDTAMNIRSLGNPGGIRQRGAEEVAEEICELREIWMYGPLGTVSRYIVVCGDWVIEDQDLTNEVSYCPLHYARYRNDGTFHGIGIPGVLMPLAIEAETLLSHLFEYASDIDRFGFIFFPDTMVDLQQLKKGPHGLIVGRYDPDLTGSARPYHVPPPAPTDVPGRVAVTAKDLMNEMVADPEILQGDAPGRVESPTALAMLNDAANAAVATGSDNVARAKGHTDRYLVHEVSKQLAAAKDRRFPIKNLDVSLVGSVISGGRETGESLGMTFSNNPLPTVSRLRFSIKEKRPRLREARRQEVALAFTQGRLDSVEFKIINFRENLGLPMDARIIANSLRSATLNALLLFNDGQQAGEAITQHDLAGDHSITLHILNELMSMPEFLLAGAEVQGAFVTWKQDEMRLLGQFLPGDTPPVDEAAAIFDRGQQILKQLGQQPGTK